MHYLKTYDALQKHGETVYHSMAICFVLGSHAYESAYVTGTNIRFFRLSRMLFHQRVLNIFSICNVCSFVKSVGQIYFFLSVTYALS